MKGIIFCETSGIVREAFRKRGFDVWSCDLLPSEDDSPYHLQCDAREVLQRDWDFFIAHPPCTYLSSSGLHWNKRIPGRAQKTEEAVEFARLFFEAKHVRYRAIENPIGRLGTVFGKATQIIQPHEYGEDASKATCLWLYGLPKLVPTKHIPPRIVIHNGKEVKRWANQTDSGQNRLGPSPDRWKERSRTYPGIADAMADRWLKFMTGVFYLEARGH